MVYFKLNREDAMSVFRIRYLIRFFIGLFLLLLYYIMLSIWFVLIRNGIFYPLSLLLRIMLYLFILTMTYYSLK